MSSLGKVRMKGAKVPNFRDLKERVWRCNLDLVRHGLVLFTFGNASAIDRDAGAVAIKPSGVPYKELKDSDIVVVDLDNRVIEGKLNPSADTKTHLVLYRSFPEIGGVVHTHATHSVAWAQARRSIPVYGTTHADHLARPVPCTLPMNEKQVRGDYETETGNMIVTAFAGLSCKEAEMVLVAEHGPFTWGHSPEKAVYNAVVLEELARMALYTELLAPNAAGMADFLIRKHWERKHGKNAYYGQKGSEYQP